MRKVLVVCAILGVSLAWAKSYNLTLFEPSVIGGTELKPGQYKLELKSDTVVISNGKQSGEASVKVENTDTKFSSTTVRYNNGDGKYRIQEIRLGGTKMKLVLN